MFAAAPTPDPARRKAARTTQRGAPTKAATETAARAGTVTANPAVSVRTVSILMRPTTLDPIVQPIVKKNTDHAVRVGPAPRPPPT